MDADHPEVLAFLRRSMVARIATQSRSGRPSITPLYFVRVKGRIWLGTAEWTLAAREAKADPRVCVLFQKEQDLYDRRVLRLTGRAAVLTDPKLMRSNVFWTVIKYILTPGGILNYLVHLRLLPLSRRYHAQSAAKGRACVIEVTPEQCEFLGGDRSNL